MRKTVLCIVISMVLLFQYSISICETTENQSVEIKLVSYDFSASNNWGEKNSIYTIGGSSYEFLDTDYGGFDLAQHEENMSMHKVLLRFQIENHHINDEENNIVQIMNVRSFCQGDCYLFPKGQMFFSTGYTEDEGEMFERYWLLEALCVYPIDIYIEDAVESAICDTEFECDIVFGKEEQRNAKIHIDDSVKRKRLLDDNAYSAVVSSIKEELLSVDSDFYDEEYIKGYISRYIPQAVQCELLENPENFVLTKISFYIENRIGAGICNIRRRMTYPTDNIWMIWGTDDSGGDFQVYWGEGKYFCEDILLLYRKDNYPQIEELMNKLRISISLSNEYAGYIDWEEGGGSGWPGPIIELPLIYNN